MLLLVERAGVKLSSKNPGVGHELCPSSAERVCDELDDRTGDGNLEVVLIEENVHGANDCTDEKANEPGANGVDILARVVGRFDLDAS